MILLKKLREQEDLTMARLEKLTGVNRVVINNIENRNVKPANENLKKLADYFKIKNPLDLLKVILNLLKRRNVKIKGAYLINNVFVKVQ